MKKTTGKVLSLVLSLALVLTSFPAMFASASSKHTVTGTLSDTDKDKIYLVNGGDKDHRTITDLQKYIFGSNDATLETADHQYKESANIAAISHKSGDRLVKWYDADSDDKDSIDDDTNSVALELRSSSSEGHEVLSILYKATYTDDDDNDVTIKGTKTFDVYVYDNGATVIGKADDDLTADSDIGVGKDTVELDDSFAEKKVSHERDDTKSADSMNLTVWEATADTNAPYITWVALKTAADDKGFDQDANTDTYYTLKSSNNNIDLTDGKTAATSDTIYGTMAGGTPEAVTETKTYTVTGTAAATDTAAGVAFTTGETKLATTKSTGDSADDWTYYYKVGADKATKSDSTVTLTDGIDLASVTDGQKVAVTAFDKDDNEKGTVVVTVKVESTAAVEADDCPTIAQDTANLNTLTVTKAANDTEGKWTYSYSVDGTDKGTVVLDSGKITVPSTIKEHKIVVTAKDTDTVKGSTTATVEVTSKSNNDSKDAVTATVKKASSGSITFTAEITDWAKDNTSATPTGVELSTTKDIKVKSKIEKKIIVDLPTFTNLVKYSGSTYISSETSLDKESVKASEKKAVKVNSLEVNFDNGEQDIKVADKASVAKITGKVKAIDISDGSNVGSIALDTLDSSSDPSITVSDAKVGDIDFDDANDEDSGGNQLSVNSTKASVGNVTDATSIEVKSGKTGDLTAAKKIDISADDDESATTVGNIKATEITIDSEDSKVTTGTVTAKDTDTEITLQGNNLSVKGFDFDNYNASLKFDDFQGKIAAPDNATQDGANISTTNGDDRVEITNDCDVDSVTIEDDSQITFDGKLDVSSIDGDGTLAIAAGKMYIDSDVSGTTLKLTDATIAKGTTAFTSLSDTVDEDDFECYGFTLAKTEGSKTDTFKVDSIVFKGLSVNKSSSDIANGYSETFTAYAYPGGTTMPSGYTVKWAIDADDSIFELTTNDNGTATVKVIGYDADFASNDKATLTATLVDPDGEECDTDEYAVGECALTALQVPKVTCTSDTNANFSLAQGASYQFKITSSDGAEPTFGVGSGSLAVSKVGKSGNDYFYKVTAVGKVGDQVGVYLNKTRLLVVTISAPSIQLDTGATIKVAQGKTYQFKATSTTTVNPTSGNSAVFQVVKVTKTGNNTYFTVKAVGSKGQSTGIYVNGVRRTVATVA